MLNIISRISINHSVLSKEEEFSLTTLGLNIVVSFNPIKKKKEEQKPPKHQSLQDVITEIETLPDALAKLLNINEERLERLKVLDEKGKELLGNEMD